MIPYFTPRACIPGEHYMLPPERRLGAVLALIDDRRFFTLHAGRQTGKTTSLMWLEARLNAAGSSRAIWVDIETAREQPDPAVAMKVVLACLEHAYRSRFRDLKLPTEAERQACEQIPETALVRYLSRLAELDPRPLVVLFDEVDGLVGQAMVSFLTQLRHGYIERSRSPFPSSVVLVGQRQVRDYALSESERRSMTWLGTTSPFNITAQATTLAAFTEPEVGELLEQHTKQTGQRFEAEAVKRIWELGQGHPWLTNAMADQIVRLDVTEPERGDHGRARRRGERDAYPRAAHAHRLARS